MTSQPVAVILIMTCRHQKNLNLSLFFLLPLLALSVSRRLLLPVAIKVPRDSESQTRPDAHQAQLQSRGLFFPCLACTPGWPGSPALGSGAPMASWQTSMAWDQCCGPPAWQVHSTQGQGTQWSPRRDQPGKSLSGGDTEWSRAPHNRGGGKTSLTSASTWFSLPTIRSGWYSGAGGLSMASLQENKGLTPV